MTTKRTKPYSRVERGFTPGGRQLKRPALFIKGAFKGHVIAALLATVLAWAIPGKSAAYIMPTGQVIGLMSANFSSIKTMVITQTTLFPNTKNQEAERSFKEKLWLKSPGIFRSEVTTVTDGLEGDAQKTATRKTPADRTFRRLLMSGKKEEIMGVLDRMGIDLEVVAFDRFDGVIVYRIGDKALNTPKLLIEKKRFLPLFLSYMPPMGIKAGDSRGQVRRLQKNGRGLVPLPCLLCGGRWSRRALSRA